MTGAKPADPADPRLMSGAGWDELCDALRSAGRRVLDPESPATPRDRAEGYRYLARFLASGIANCITHDDPDYPVFGRMIEYARPWGLDSPDCLYLYAPLRGGAGYRVWGRRGSARFVDFQVNWGHFANGDISQWGTIGSLDSFALQTDADGSFELWIGGEERAGNWIPSAANAEFLLVRQLFQDWERERPADLLIERSDAEWPIPPPRSDWAAERLAKLARWIEQGGGLWEQMSRGILSMPPNSMTVILPEDAGARAGAGSQAYGMGNFACADDEAVIVELALPPCHYWSLSLANYWWECVEYASRQSSLNGAQARVDADGVFRGVIAQRDPGVANWLDPAGNPRGSLAARFVRPEAKPEVAFRVVPLAELDAALPPETPRVAPAERARRLERRRRAVWSRFRR